LLFTAYGGPEVLTWGDAPVPHAGPGQIRIAVRAASVNPVDWKMLAGAMSGGQPLAGTGYLGYDAAGVVDEVGEGVTGVSEGDGRRERGQPGLPAGDQGDPRTVRRGRGRPRPRRRRRAGRRGVRRRGQDPGRGADQPGIRAIPGIVHRQLRGRPGRGPGDRWRRGQQAHAGAGGGRRTAGPEQPRDQGADVPVRPRRRGLPHQPRRPRPRKARLDPLTAATAARSPGSGEVTTALRRAAW